MATIAGIASSAGNFTVLLAALNFIDDNVPGSALVTTLSDPAQDLTVFAPTDAAFGNLAVNLGYTGDPADTGAVATFLVTNVPATTLETIVLYHVSGGAQTAADITAAGTVATLEGTSIGAMDLPTLVDGEPDLIDPSLVTTDIPADNGIVHIIDQVLLPIDLPDNDAPTITEIVLTSGTGFDTNGEDFDLLREAVVAADLAGALNDPNADLTAFAPNDAAFVGLAQTLGYDGDDEAGAFGYIVSALRLLSGGADPIPLLTTILQYHVAPESLQASQVLALEAIPTLIDGATLAVNADDLTLGDAEPDVADPALVATDIQAANGVVHVIDGVLIPADLPLGDPDVAFVIGSDAGEAIRGKKGDDLIDGQGGNDNIRTGLGDDLILGGDGRDWIHSGRGDDTVYGEDGRDFVHGSGGDDEIYGGGSGDRLFGGGGDDEVYGGEGRDLIRGGSGNDSIDGGAGRDFIYGGRDEDVIDGGASNDLIFGGSGDDQIAGGDGGDQLFGGFGNDTIDGGAGGDIMLGGFGSDTFVFAGGSGDDRILDFSNNDVIDLTGFGFESFDEVDDALDTGLFQATLEIGDDSLVIFGTGVFSLDQSDFLI